MPIPDYQSVRLPLLRFASDNKENQLHEAIDFISNYSHYTIFFDNTTYTIQDINYGNNLY